MSQKEPVVEIRRLAEFAGQAVTLQGWRPRWSVSEAVRRTALWYRSFYQQASAARTPGSMREACLADIADYQATGSADWRLASA